jgi:hypothetical protein
MTQKIIHHMHADHGMNVIPADFMINIKLSMNNQHIINSSRVENARHIDKIPAEYVKKKKPKLGSFSLPVMPDTPGKPRIAFLFCSCGKYGQILVCLPKYGRFAPLPWAANAPAIDLDSAM